MMSSSEFIVCFWLPVGALAVRTLNVCALGVEAGAARCCAWHTLNQPSANEPFFGSAGQSLGFEILTFVEHLLD